MSQPYSHYQIDCANCGETVTTTGASVKCHECGTLLVVESWQAQHTQLADGRIVETATLEKKR